MQTAYFLVPDWNENSGGQVHIPSALVSLTYKSISFTANHTESRPHTREAYAAHSLPPLAPRGAAEASGHPRSPEPNLYTLESLRLASFTHTIRSGRAWYLSLSAMKMTLLSRSREAKTLTRCRTLREENRDSKSTCSSRESRGRHSSITCQGTEAALKVGLHRTPPWRQGRWTAECSALGHVRSSSWKSLPGCPLDGLS